jgi:hypothetical protein
MNGAKRCTEAADFYGRGAFHTVRSVSVSGRGLYGSENVGLSSENMGENPMHRNPKGSSGRLVRGGLVWT